MITYQHKVQYYETDKMGVTHHSNYIRWMEEARVEFLEQLGYGYDRLEAEGLMSPVIGINGKYKESTTFPDLIEIAVSVKEFKGVRLIIGYKMTNTATGHLVFEGTSEHCFTNKEGTPILLKKENPEFYQLLTNLV